MTMKLKLQRETLLKPLQMVIGVVEKKQTLPILSNVLLNTQGDLLAVTGTDLEVELIGQATLESPVPTNEQLTIPGRKLIDICKALPENAPVELYQDKERIIVRSGRSRFTLSTLPAADFPSVETCEGQLTFSISQRDLLQLLQRTYFAMAQQDVRYYLNGMLLEVYKNCLRAVATDGHRLAMNTTTLSLQEEHRLQIIIPRKGVMELMRLLSDVEDVVNVTVGNNHIQIANDNYIFTSKLIEGRFPDYERVIPENSDKKIQIDRVELKGALSRAAILCNEKFRGVRFGFQSNLLRISANNPEQEAAEEEININYPFDNLSIGFNVNYLLDILNTINSATIKLLLSDSNSSMLIKDSSNLDSCFVVMPMRL
jgi:DNA polymerase III subunit beta